jgi:hypothetical protein
MGLSACRRLLGGASKLSHTPLAPWNQSLTINLFPPPAILQAEDRRDGLSTGLAARADDGSCGKI